jgi:hypothetical protein
MHREMSMAMDITPMVPGKPTQRWLIYAKTAVMQRQITATSNMKNPIYCVADVRQFSGFYQRMKAPHKPA